MSVTEVLKKAGKFEIQEYKPPSDYKALSRTHVPFSGSPRKHPFDSEKVVLMPDPFTFHPHYFEFRIADVSYIEKLPNLIDLDGDNVPMIRMWIKKKSVAVLCTPFVVAGTHE
jgi:hypothetical protein